MRLDPCICDQRGMATVGQVTPSSPARALQRQLSGERSSWRSLEVRSLFSLTESVSSTRPVETKVRCSTDRRPVGRAWRLGASRLFSVLGQLVGRILERAHPEAGGRNPCRHQHSTLRRTAAFDDWACEAHGRGGSMCGLSFGWGPDRRDPWPYREHLFIAGHKSLTG